MTSLAVDQAGDVFVTGYVKGYNGRDIFTAKYRGTTGEEIWSQQYDGAGGDDSGFSLAIDPAGNVIVIGQSSQYNPYNPLRVIKYRGDDGTTLWSVGIGDGMFIDQIVIDASGDAYVGGRVNSSYTLAGAHLMKLSGSTGAVVWSIANPALSPFRSVTSLALDPAGNLLVGGISSSTTYSAFMGKVSAQNGQVIWHATRVAGNQDSFSSIDVVVASDASGNLLAALQDNGYVATAGFLTIKFAASDGQQLWSTQIDNGTNTGAFPRRVATDSEGHVIVTGTIRMAGNIEGIGTIRFNSADGSVLWQQFAPNVLATAAYSEGNTIVSLPDGNFAVAGTSNVDNRYRRAIRAIKHNRTSGAPVWDSVVNRLETDGVATGTTRIADGVVVSGCLGEYNAGKKHRVARFDGNGNEVWRRDWPDVPLAEQSMPPCGGLLIDIGPDVVSIASGVKDTWNLNADNTGYSRAVRHAGASGNVAWAQELDNINHIDRMMTDGSGNIFISGTYRLFAQATFVDGNFISKLNGATGDVIWQNRYSIPDYNNAGGFRLSAKIALDSAGNVLATGAIGTGGGAGTAWIQTRKLDGATGSTLWTHTYPSPAPSNFAGVAIAVDAANDAYVAGTLSMKLAGSNGNLIWESARSSTDVAYSPAGIVLFNEANVVSGLDPTTGALVWQTLQTISSYPQLRKMVVDPTGRVFVLNSGINVLDASSGTVVGTYTNGVNAISFGTGGIAYLARSGSQANRRSSFNVLKAEFPANTGPPYILTANKSGDGTGTIAFSPEGAEICYGCARSYADGTMVTLTATPDPSSTFSGWSGSGCSGTGTCQVPMTSARTVTALFTVKRFQVVVTRPGNGSGNVTSASGINCGATCAVQLTYGASITLTAVPESGSYFAGWSGVNCTATPICVIQGITQPVNAKAVFSTGAVKLTVGGGGFGGVGGSISSTPFGIDCGAVCSYSFTAGTVVTLSATPTNVSALFKWTVNGNTDTCPGTGTCTITLNADTQVFAWFVVHSYQVEVLYAGTGSGRVGVQYGGNANCGVPCIWTFSAFAGGTLTATPIGASVFSGWSGGGCSGTGNCSPTYNVDSVVTATFTAVAPSAPPSPTSVSVTTGDGRLIISFSPPANDNGAPITNYTATCVLASGGAGSFSATGTTSPLVVTGLTNGTTYVCSVAATNSLGTSPASAGYYGTPDGTVNVELVRAYSRKVHGSAGTFDLQRKAGTNWVEPRLGDGGHSLVFEFNKPVIGLGLINATAYPGGSAPSEALAVSEMSYSDTRITFTVAKPVLPSRIVLLINGVQTAGSSDSNQGFIFLAVPGDVSQSLRVGAADIAAIKARRGQPLNETNFSFDLDLNGAIDDSDVQIVKSRSGTIAPSY